MESKNTMTLMHSLAGVGGASDQHAWGLFRAGGNKKITLMHYLSALVASKEPHLLDFAHDLRGYTNKPSTLNLTP